MLVVQMFLRVKIRMQMFVRKYSSEIEFVWQKYVCKSSCGLKVVRLNIRRSNVRKNKVRMQLLVRKGPFTNIRHKFLRN